MKFKMAKHALNEIPSETIRMDFVSAAITVAALSSILSSPARGQDVVFDPFRGAASQPSGSEEEDQGSIIPQVDFNDQDIGLVFKIISDSSGWSITPSKAVRGKVSLWAKSITSRELLDRVTVLGGFVYEQEGNIISVMTFEEYQEYYGVVKEVVTLENAPAQEVAAILTAFLTKRGKLVPYPETNSIVLYETKENLELLKRVISAIDIPVDKAVIEVIKLKFAEATELAKLLTDVYQVRGVNQQTQGNTQRRILTTQPAGRNAASLFTEAAVSIHPEPKTNQIIVRGHRADVERIKELIVALDDPGDSLIRNYQVTHVEARQVYDSLRGLLGVTGDAAQGSAIRVGLIEGTNSLVVQAPPATQERVEAFLATTDIPIQQIPGGIKSYRLENANARQVAEMLLDLIEQARSQRQLRQRRETEAISTREPGMITGPGESQPPSSPLQIESSSPPQPASPLASAGTPGAEGLTPYALVRRIEDARVSFSEETNLVIIEANAEQHAQFEKLILELDRRRDQVLIEAILVDVRTDEDLDLGVELESFQAISGSAGHLLFTSFGLSTIDTATGLRQPIVQPGGTGALIRANEVPIIVRALESTGKARVRAAPRLLVNDNAQGSIQSIAEEPTQSVNASQTVATTSFAGFVQAGTQFTITPRISEGDHLRVEYQITQNSFRGTSVDPTLPPARDTVTIQSEATIPDDYAIIVGGLKSNIQREDEQKLPLIGDIPILGLLARRTVNVDTESMLYVFLTPTILRDDQFRDLKMISDQDRTRADEEDPYPQNPAIELNEESIPFEDDNVSEEWFDAEPL